jgi:hypothetical protein
VRNVNDRHAGGVELGDELEQTFGLPGSEGCRRLP